jgi:hypothetical protein
VTCGLLHRWKGQRNARYCPVADAACIPLRPLPGVAAHTAAYIHNIF